MRITASAAVIGTLILAATANASMIVQQGNNPQPNQENVLLDMVSSQPTVVLGKTNQSATQVSFTSSVPLTSNPQGQATISAASGSFNNLTVALPGGGSFASLILSVDLAGNGTSCASCISFSAISNEPGGGTANLTSSTFGAGPGQTFFTIMASGGESFRQLSLSSNGVGLSDVQQVRIALAGGTTPVPEPSTFALMGGALAFVYAASRRLRRRA
jgi:hypothetical protein